MDPDRWEEPQQQSVLEMSCPECGCQTIKWAVDNAVRRAAESFPEEWWLKCRTCGYEPEDDEYLPDLQGGFEEDEGEAS